MPIQNRSKSPSHFRFCDSFENETKFSRENSSNLFQLKQISLTQMRMCAHSPQKKKKKIRGKNILFGTKMRNEDAAK